VRRLLAACVALLAFTSLSAQTHGYVSLDDTKTYAILSSLQSRGLISVISQPKPYTASFITSVLESVLDGDGLSADERLAVQRCIDDLTPTADHAFGALAQTDINLSLRELSDPHAISGLGLSYGGDIFPWLSIGAEFSMLLDTVNDDAFIPYTYTKTWDHHHMGLMTRSDDEMWLISNRTFNEAVVATEDGANYVRVGRYRRDWGPGAGSLLLSGTARPFDGVEAGVRLLDFGYVSSVVGSLGSTVGTDTDSEQKMLSAHRLTLTPFNWLTLSFWESVIWGKRFELAYLSPVSIYMISQMATAGDMDNSTMGFDLEARLPPWGTWYGSLYIDEIDHTALTELFTNPKNMFAFYTGITVPVPGLSFGLARVQYTKLEPFVYTHYIEYDYPFFSNSSGININYTNDGQNLGYALPPNSDQFLLALTWLPLPELVADVQLSYMRHGDNPGATGYVIMGDIDEDLDYTHLSSYPDKDFLHDGIYERILSAYGRVSWAVPDHTLTLYAGYGLSWARNYQNVEGATAWIHVLTIGGRYQLPVWSRSADDSE